MKPEMKKFIISKIAETGIKDEKDLEKRLYDLGFHPGLEVEIVAKVSFSFVTIVQFGATRIALNDEEFACLHGH